MADQDWLRLSRTAISCEVPIFLGELVVFGSSLGFLQFQAAGDENAENGAASGDVTTRFDAEPDSAGGVTDE